jgi:hypothetical protein
VIVHCAGAGVDMAVAGGWVGVGLGVIDGTGVPVGGLVGVEEAGGALVGVEVEADALLKCGACTAGDARRVMGSTVSPSTSAYVTELQVGKQHGTGTKSLTRNMPSDWLSMSRAGPG